MKNTIAYTAYTMTLTAFALTFFSIILSSKTAQQQTHLFNSATDHTDYLLSHSYAVLVTTNLVPQNCPCGYCHYDTTNNIATRVPEHINQIGYDLRIEVSTNYLPIICK